MTNKTKSLKEPLFRLSSVDFSYGKIPLLNNISVDIFPGERIALLGANGSGKSTLLKLLGGLAFPTYGTITAFGHPVSKDYFSNVQHEFSFRKKVGFVFQDSDVQLFCQSVWDEVAFGPLHLGLSNEEVIARTEETLNKLAIWNLKDRSPYTLSGGEKKKVAIATVLSIEPDVWILDEPTASLDPRTQSLLLDVLWQMHEKGSTIIVTTHDLVLLDELADRVLLMSEDHRIVADRTPKDILADTDLLVSHNLVHEHTHGHGGHRHTHRHTHTSKHEE